MLVTLGTGLYAVQLKGIAMGTGIGLFEIYGQ